MPKEGVDTNKFKKWPDDIFGTGGISEKDFVNSLLEDEELEKLYFYLNLLSGPEKTYLATRIKKYQELSSSTLLTASIEATASTEATASKNLIKAFITVNNAKAKLDKKAEGVEYTEKQGDGTDIYKITLTKEKHTISIPDKKTGELYTAVFTKNVSDGSYTMTIEITGVNGATKQGGDTDFQKMQDLVKQENHKVTLMVGEKPINLFDNDINKTIEAINGELSAKPPAPAAPAAPRGGAAAEGEGEALGGAAAGAAAEGGDGATGATAAEAPPKAPAPVAAEAPVAPAESSLSWANWIKGAGIGAGTGAGTGFLVAGAIAGIAVVATAPISLPMIATIAAAGAGAGALAGAGAGLLSGIKTQNEVQGDAGFCKIVTNAIVPSATAGGIAGLATGAGAIAGAVAAHGALGTGAFATGATSHAACVSTGASAAVSIIGNTAIAYSKGEASLSKFGIDATLATVGIGGGEALFNFSHLLTESADLAIGRNITAIAAEFCKYKCQEEQEKKPLASLASAAFSGLSAAYSVGAAEFGAADSLRHVGESPSQQHHNLLEDMQRVFGRGDYDQIKEYQEHVFKIFSLGECETGSVLNLAENQNKIDNFLHENPEAIKNLYHYLMPTETKNNVYGELEFISHHAEDIVALDNFFASDTTNTDGEKLSLLEQLKVVNALKQVDPDFTLETTTTFDDYFKEHKSIITQAMGYNCSNPHPITSQDFCNLLLKTGGEEEFQKSLNHLAKLQSETKQMFDLKTSDTSHSHHHHSIEKLTENQASLIEQLKTHEEILKNMAHDLDVLNKTDYSSSLHQTNSPTKKVEILMDMMYDAHTKLDGFFTKDELSGYSIADKLRFVATLSENSQDITSDTDFATYYKNNTGRLIEKTIHLFNPQDKINETNFIDKVLNNAGNIDKEYGKLNTDANVPFAQKVDFLTEYTKAQNKILNYFSSQNNGESFALGSIEEHDTAIHNLIKDDPRFQFVNSTSPHDPNGLYSKYSLDKIGAKFEARMQEIKHIVSSDTYYELSADDQSGYTLFAVKDQAGIVTHISVLDETDNRVVLDINSTPENETDIVNNTASVWHVQISSSVSGIERQDQYVTNPTNADALNDDGRPNEYLVAKFLRDHFKINMNTQPNNVFHDGDPNPHIFGIKENTYFHDKEFNSIPAPGSNTQQPSAIQVQQYTNWKQN